MVSGIGKCSRRSLQKILVDNYPLHSNYWNPSEICAVHTWYLAVDTQLYVLAPILLITIKKFPRVSILAVLLLAFLSMSLAFEVTWRNSLGATYLKQGIDEYEKLYTPTHIRIVTWLFGSITGYFIAENKTLPMRKIFVYFLWVLSLSSLVFLLLIEKFFNDYEYNVLYSSLFNTFSRPLWGVAICIIILLCVYNHGGIIGWLLSSAPFNVLIRINYSIYLIHSLVTSIILSKMRTTVYLSVFSILHDTLGDYCIVLVLATLWTLAFESPIIALEKLWFPKGQITKEDKNCHHNGSSETIIVK
ncbi:hypothetical protein WA026_019205 [Henosepilachna vigintioctopunctata]|uniref:Acyltransferase 3 domain-containing protein n=1 Tax=Henosepilachna vigintioctopunctata TaxID=420089 RepID=A0AAW1V0S2_9CUCU